MRDMLFLLMWQQHGGSGLAVGYSDAMDMRYDDAVWFAEKINSQREREARAVRDANRRR